jgi:hypothetical protein
VRSQGAKGLSVTRTTKINRRQFLTGAFRERDLAEKMGEPRIGRKFSAPDTAPQISDWDNGIESVLEEMENTKGIEDF